MNEDLIEGEMDNTEYLLSSNKMKERLLAARESDVGTAIKVPDIYPTWRVLLICGSSGSGKTTLGRLAHHLVVEVVGAIIRHG